MGKKICSILSTILLIVLLALAGILIIPKFIGFKQFAVLSGSMEPNIHVGAICFDKACEPTSLEVGDVITYQLADGTMVTHRIVEIDADNQTVSTQGDANDAMDASPVPYQNIVGKVQFNIPYIGYISIYGRTPLGIAGVCGVLIIVILLNFLPDALSSEEKKDIAEEESKEETQKEEK